MPTRQEVSHHYTRGNLVAAIRGGVEALGKTINSVTIDDLAPVDEYHIGGRQASEDFLSQLNLTPGKHVLDVGCGLGGAARFVASRYGCHVTEIDLTPEFIETAKVLRGWVGLDSRVSLHLGSALAMPFADHVFDCAYMLHVGMNIVDKAKLCSEVSRVLRPNSLFGIYDVMRIGDGELAYPVHWATTAASSAVATPAQYREVLEKAGFAVIAERNRHDFALAQYHLLRAKTAKVGSPPPLGLHILMGNNTSDYVQNMIENVSTGRIAPVELVARKS
jgi:ubiquinone/menaquinone biosynthesis C-methylase UbiE